MTVQGLDVPQMFGGDCQPEQQYFSNKGRGRGKHTGGLRKDREPQFGRRREGALLKRLAEKSLVNISQFVKIKSHTLVLKICKM